MSEIYIVALEIFAQNLKIVTWVTMALAHMFI